MGQAILDLDSINSDALMLALFERVFKRIGKPCWNVKPGHGSFLTFECGESWLTGLCLPMGNGA